MDIQESQCLEGRAALLLGEHPGALSIPSSHKAGWVLWQCCADCTALASAPPAATGGGRLHLHQFAELEW